MSFLYLPNMHAVHSARTLKGHLDEAIQFLERVPLANSADLKGMRNCLNYLKEFQAVLYLAVQDYEKGVRERMEKQRKEKQERERKEVKRVL